MLELMKSLLFHKPEAWEKYPFRAEPPRISHYREFPPPRVELSHCLFIRIQGASTCTSQFCSVYNPVGLLFPVSQNLVSLMTYSLFSLNEGRAEKGVLWNDASSPTREIWSSSQKQGWRQGLLSGRKGEIQKKLSKPLCKLSIARGLGLLRTLTSIERFHSRGQQNKRNVLRKKRVQLPQDWFGTPTWPLFHCFGTPIWPPWRHVETIYSN